MVDFIEPIKKGLAASVQPKRFLPILVLDLAACSIVLLAFMVNLTGIMSTMITIITDPASLASLNILWYVAGLLVIGAVWGLIRIWVGGALVHHSWKEKEYNKSWKVAWKLYPRLLGVTLIVFVITLVVSVVPYINWLLSLIVGLLFFFIMQSVVVGGKKIFDALNDSVNVFKENWLEVILTYVFITVVSIVILVIFSIPLWYAIFSQFSGLSVTETASPAIVGAIFSRLLSNMPLLVGAGIVFLVGVAIDTSFALKAQTEYYLQLRKKSGILEKIM